MTWSIAEELEEQRKPQEASCASDEYGFVSKRVFPNIEGAIHIVQSFSHAMSLARITCITALFLFDFPSIGFTASEVFIIRFVLGPLGRSDLRVLTCE